MTQCSISAPPVRFIAFGRGCATISEIEAMRAFARVCARRPNLDLYFDLAGTFTADVAENGGIYRQGVRIRLHGYLPDDQVHKITHASHDGLYLTGGGLWPAGC